MRSRPRNRTRARIAILAATGVVIAVGLALRLVPLGLPGGVVKYGGSVLWGAMVYGLVAAVGPASRWRILAISALIAMAVELFRLVHAPWLDAFRLTLAGKLLIGRVYSPWNLVAYAVGLITAGFLDRRFRT
ncbi:DUF2809 domain-containing protein [Methylobacterium sp. BTF04]|uniref:ribosomal maturation YjgA family protein n=1 Tax=Methylobacterium sp. BTF04 TaxID=2708300 RepID=UPI0013D1D333|nr:DUF2809 domain-containing protein [Methylobacterium sp. BTF04]NEU12187.1 DUF2809 domain-containing protein [Methylobacterium sp. BTF04]